MNNEKIMRLSADEAALIERGIQCPECFGVRIVADKREPHMRQLFQCNECGERWGADRTAFMKFRR